MTLGECLAKTAKLINYYSIAGNTVPDIDPTRTDYNARARAAADTAQKEIARARPLVRHATITQHTLRPRVSSPEFRRLTGSLTLEAKGANVFSLLCDGNITAEMEVYLGGSWQQSLILSVHGRDNLGLVHGGLDSPVGDATPVRLTITGNGVFISSVGMYAAFPEGEGIPLVEMRRFHDLPEDFGRIERMDMNPQFSEYRRNGFYEISEGRIGFPWDFDGVASFDYAVYPKTLDESTPDTETISVPDDAAEAIPYYAAALLFLEEDPHLSGVFMELYRDKMSAINNVKSWGVKNGLFGGGR